MERERSAVYISTINIHKRYIKGRDFNFGGKFPRREVCARLPSRYKILSISLSGVRTKKATTFQPFQSQFIITATFIKLSVALTSFKQALGGRDILLCR